MSGITTICFAGSYAIALVLEISRLVFRSGVRGAMMIGFAGAGLVAHSAFLYHRAVSRPRSPLSSEQDWYLLAAWLLVVIYLYLTIYYPKQAFGLFLFPLVLALIGVATFLAAPEPYPRGPASRTWGMVHGTSILLATVVVLFGLVTGLMYLAQARRLKHKRPPIRGLRLPSLEWLQRANSRAIVVSLILLGVGVLSGLVLTSLSHGGRVAWNDPVVLGTFGLFFWLLVAAMVNVFYKPARAGRKVAYLTLVSFVFLVVVLGVGLWSNTAHGGLRRSSEIQPFMPNLGTSSTNRGDLPIVCLRRSTTRNHETKPRVNEGSR
ncbi:MAG: cytochrome c biogenesis protein CcsA [Pirellulales bacterium]|nr:cytochrome c biogenesis protein CcsA [Pirellulales bacterium]